MGGVGCVCVCVCLGDLVPCENARRLPPGAPRAAHQVAAGRAARAQPSHPAARLQPAQLLAQAGRDDLRREPRVQHEVKRPRAAHRQLHQHVVACVGARARCAQGVAAQGGAFSGQRFLPSLLRTPSHATQHVPPPPPPPPPHPPRPPPPPAPPPRRRGCMSIRHFLPCALQQCMLSAEDPR
jgi:hypothetical protein